MLSNRNFSFSFMVLLLFGPNSITIADQYSPNIKLDINDGAFTFAGYLEYNFNGYDALDLLGDKVSKDVIYSTSLSALKAWHLAVTSGNVEQIISSYYQRDGSQKRIKEELDESPDTLVALKKIEKVSVHGGYKWGEYVSWRVTWHMANGKTYLRSIDIGCVNEKCGVSDYLKKSGRIQDHVNGVISAHILDVSRNPSNLGEVFRNTSKPSNEAKELFRHYSPNESKVSPLIIYGTIEPYKTPIVIRKGVANKLDFTPSLSALDRFARAVWSIPSNDYMAFVRSDEKIQEFLDLHSVELELNKFIYTYHATNDSEEPRVEERIYDIYALLGKIFDTHSFEVLASYDMQSVTYHFVRFSGMTDISVFRAGKKSGDAYSLCSYCGEGYNAQIIVSPVFIEYLIRQIRDASEQI